MGCEISKFPHDVESTLEQQKNTLETISSCFQPMEEKIQAAIDKKKESYNKVQEILAWKDESEKKIARIEELLKKLQTQDSEESFDIINMDSLESEIENQYEELLKIISDLKEIS